MITLQFVAIIVCMCLYAFFAGIETGVISIHRMRLRHFVKEGEPGAHILEGFIENSDRLLGTTLVGTNICVVVTSVVAASLARRAIPTGGEAVASVATTLLVLVFCEFLPKAWFRNRPIERCSRFVPGLRLAELLFKPISVTVVGITKLLVPGPSKSFTKPVPFVTREDLKILAREGEKDGVLSPRERDMIHRVFELSGKRAGEIVIPRKEMTAVYTDMSIPEFYNMARSRRFTRMPVIDRETDKFVGIINVFYVLSSPHANDDGASVAQFMRRPLVISADMPVDDIFPLLRRARQPMCLVTDADEDVIGLITTEDILEEIVGNL